MPSSPTRTLTFHPHIINEKVNHLLDSVYTFKGNREPAGQDKNEQRMLMSPSESPPKP